MSRLPAVPGNPDAGFTQPLSTSADLVERVDPLDTADALSGDDLAKDVIWWRFPTRILDLVAVLALAGVIAAIGFGREVPALVFTAPVLSLLAIVDLREKILPRGFVYIATAWSILAASSVPMALVGAAAVGVAYFIIWFIRPNGIGFGDVRLAFAVGALLTGNLRSNFIGFDDFSFFDVFYGALFLPFLLTGLVAVPALLLSRSGKIGRVKVPLGPAMVIGAVLVMALPGGFLLNASMDLMNGLLG